MIETHIREWIAKEKITITEFARRMRVSRVTVYNWMNGEMTLSTLRMLARCVGKEPWEMLKP